ncbi:MAG: hypothetical protein ACRD2E_03545 [Terriglobales bacterium]
MATFPGRFLSVLRGRMYINLEQVSYYQVEDNGKVKLHFSNGESKELEGADASLFLTTVGHEPLAPAA